MIHIHNLQSSVCILRCVLKSKTSRLVSTCYANAVLSMHWKFSLRLTSVATTTPHSVTYYLSIVLWVLFSTQPLDFPLKLPLLNLNKKPWTLIECLLLVPRLQISCFQNKIYWLLFFISLKFVMKLIKWIFEIHLHSD